MTVTADPGSHLEGSANEFEPGSEPEPGPASASAAAPSARAITIRNASKAYGRLLALDGISLDIAAGQFVCIVGASGCGKSTLLNLVAGLDRPTAGTVEVPGGRVAMMFQESALFPWLTVERNVDLALRLRGVPRNRRHAEVGRLLDLVHLGEFSDRRPHELSGGMRQRVALARALAQEAQVLLMDEPFGALDAITRDLLHDELERLWAATGLTVVFVTHNVREAARLGDRIVLLSSRPGRVAEDYAVDIPRPRRVESPAVAALAGGIVDRLRAEVVRHGAHD